MAAGNALPMGLYPFVKKGSVPESRNAWWSFRSQISLAKLDREGGRPGERGNELKERCERQEDGVRMARGKTTVR